MSEATSERIRKRDKLKKLFVHAKEALRAEKILEEGASFMGVGHTEKQPANAAAPEKFARNCTMFKGHMENSIYDDFDIVEKLGRGTFGTVALAVEKSTKQKMAVKIVPLNVAGNSDAIDSFLHEAEVMMHVRGHPNVLKIHSFYEDLENLYVVMELCPSGDLVQAVTARNMHFSENVAAGVMKSIMESVAHCHFLGVVHRDIKLDNFMLSDRGRGLGENVRLADFGGAAFFTNGEMMDSYVGTLEYMAPEVHEGAYSTPADIWSCGCSMYTMLVGRFPFPGRERSKVYKIVKTMEPDMEHGPWRDISEEAKDAIKAMLRKDPSKRPTAVEVLQMPWFHQEGHGRDTPLVGPLAKRVVDFANFSQFKQEVLRAMVPYLSEESISGYKQLFLKSTGAMDPVPISHIEDQLKGRGLSEEEIKDLLPTFRLTAEGLLTFPEIMAHMASASNVQHKGLLEKVYDKLDPEGSGHITAHAALLVLKSNSETQVQQMLDEAGAKDGVISKDMFFDIMLDHVPRDYGSIGSSRYHTIMDGSNKQSGACVVM